MISREFHRISAAISSGNGDIAQLAGRLLTRTIIST